jgi:DNA-binding CsgD family transcriptional regulator
VGPAIPWDSEIYPLLFAVAGALLAVSLPRHPAGWLMLFVGACFAANAFALQSLGTGHPAGAAGLAWWAERGSAVLVPATLLLVMVLPDGRLPSDAWRPIARLMVGVQLAVIVAGAVVAGPVATEQPPPAGEAGLDNPFGLLPESWSRSIDAAIGPVLVVPFVLGVAAVAQRLLRPAGDERPRVRTVLGGVALFAVAVTVPDALWPTRSMWFHVAGVAVLSATIVVAVVRGQFRPVPAVGTTASVVPDPSHWRGDSRRGDSALATLSPRELEVMEYVARGWTNSQIAAELVISPITVRNHVSSILTKLDAANRTEAVARFLRGD